MGRRRDSVPVRLPGALAHTKQTGESRSASDDVVLRLSVSRAGLGLELSKAVRLGEAVEIDEISMTFPGLGFPLDLSGGVPKFRHRRGRLQRLGVWLRREPLSRWAEVRLEGLLGGTRPSVTLLPSTSGVTVGVTAGEFALAFDVTWAPLDRDMRVVVSSARTAGIHALPAAPAQALALRAIGQLFRGVALRSGSVFRLNDAAQLALREVLPRAGARLPSTEGIVWSEMSAGGVGLRLVAEQGAVGAKNDEYAASALEVAELVERADDALYLGRHDEGRAGYLQALERAPHQIEIARRLADLDRAEGGRSEAALATLVMAGPVIEAGSLGGSLLEAVGDRDAARVAYESAAETEGYAPLSALLLASAARLCEHPAERAALLARAGARAPSSAAIRWQRLVAMLELGDASACWAEIEHLEAAASGPSDKQRVLLSAGDLMLRSGLAAQAIRAYERALRYGPASEDALLGLGRSLHAAGESARGAEVLARVVALAERRGARSDEALLSLAEILADGLQELPLAIARARAITPGSPHAIAARALEARCLGKLGDRAVASQTWARVRDSIELDLATAPRDAAAWLAEAAAFELEERGDAYAARRHLGMAIRLRPRDPVLLAAFRSAAALCEPLPAQVHRVVVEPLAKHEWQSATAFAIEAPALSEPVVPSLVQPALPTSRVEAVLPSDDELVREPTLEELAELGLLPRSNVQQDPAHVQTEDDDDLVREPTPEELAELGLLPRVAMAPAAQVDDDDDVRDPTPEELAELGLFPHGDARTPLDVRAVAQTPKPLASPADLGWDDELLGGDSSEIEARVEALTALVRGNPNNLEVVIELSGLLEQLGRDMDMFALLSARLEEGDDATRALLAPLQRGVLRRLAESARRGGRESEAALYEQMREMIV